VIEEVTRASRMVRAAGQSHVDISRIARKLGTTIPWTEHCMRTYGRRPKRPGLEAAESREAEMEAFEGDEPEETFPEDLEEAGVPDLKERPEKSRRLKLQAPPTPSEGEEFLQGFER
jgi:hypothetical protein